MDDKKVSLVLGASLNPERYSNKAILRLRAFGHPVIAVGLRRGRVGDVKINTDFPSWQPIDTVTLYLSKINQEPFYSEIIALKPRRVIFNPGAENPAFEKLLSENGIEAIEACTLVLLSTGQF